MKKLKIYVAGPFFTEKQRQRDFEVRKALLGLDFGSECDSEENQVDIELYEPSSLGVISNESSNIEVLSMFSENIRGIKKSDIILVISDELDLGTVWEIGYSYAKRKIIYSVFVDTVPDKINLMLSNVFDKTFLSIDEFVDFLTDISETKFEEDV